jgi:hypothetical protein
MSLASICSYLVTLNHNSWWFMCDVCEWFLYITLQFECLLQRHVLFTIFPYMLFKDEMSE